MVSKEIDLVAQEGDKSFTPAKLQEKKPDRLDMWGMTDAKGGEKNTGGVSPETFISHKQGSQMEDPEKIQYIMALFERGRISLKLSCKTSQDTQCTGKVVAGDISHSSMKMFLGRYFSGNYGYGEEITVSNPPTLSEFIIDTLSSDDVSDRIVEIVVPDMSSEVFRDGVIADLNTVFSVILSSDNAAQQFSYSVAEVRNLMTLLEKYRNRFMDPATFAPIQRDLVWNISGELNNITSFFKRVGEVLDFRGNSELLTIYSLEGDRTVIKNSNDGVREFLQSEFEKISRILSGFQKNMHYAEIEQATTLKGVLTKLLAQMTQWLINHM